MTSQALKKSSAGMTGRFSEKDLDALLWEWAAMTLEDQDSGYPSSYVLNQRVDCGVVYIPDYFPHPKVCYLANEIFSLESEQRNPIICKYLFNMNPQEIAKALSCHRATVFRNLNKARAKLLDQMRLFVYKSYRL
jgi:hypothetical protein